MATNTIGDIHMALVKVKPKYQVTIPPTVREQLGLEVGDFLEAEVRAGRIVLIPKAVVDKGIRESLAESRAGKHGPFRTAKSTVKGLKRKPAP